MNLRTIATIFVADLLLAESNTPEWAKGPSLDRSAAEAADVLTNRALEIGQHLKAQHSGRALQADPMEVCDFYHKNSNGQLSCTCNRYDKRDTQVYCEFNDLSCNDDKTTCYQDSVDVLLDKDAVSYRTTTCRRETTSVEPSDTCITILPVTPGIYNMTLSCAVTQNGQLCSSCTQCGPNENNTQTISFDCCNVETDLKQTCGLVTEQGGAAAQFDEIPPSERGLCTSSSALRISVLVATMASLSAGASMLFF